MSPELPQSLWPVLASALAHSHDAVVVCAAAPQPTAGWHIVFVNPAFERLTGFSAHEVLGRSPRFMDSPACPADALQRLEAAMRAGTPLCLEMPAVDCHGDTLWLERSMTPVPDDQGRPSHCLSIERNIGERRQAALCREQSQRLDALRHMAAPMAHEINNLLTVILGNAELLTEVLPAGGRDHRLASLIQQVGERGLELTQRLQAFAGRRAVRPEPVALAAVRMRIDGALRQLLGERITLAWQDDAAEVQALVDPQWLATALLTLAAHAVEAMPTGGQLSIRSDLACLDDDSALATGGLRAGNYLLLTVADTGVAIPPGDLTQVFEPYAKGRSRGKGFGLAEVHGFIVQSGGHIRLDSAPGAGCTVRIYLPRAAVAQ